MEDRIDTGEVGLDFDKKEKALIQSISLGTYGINLDQIKNLVNNLKEKVMSFDTREIRFLDKGKFVVKNDRTKIVFYRDEDLYRRHAGYQPSVTCDDFDESNPPQGGSGFVVTQQ
jgi:hypothetical protein